MDFLDLIFPKRCVNCGRLGTYICRDCFSKIEYVDKPVCPICQRPAVGGKTHPRCQSRYGLDGLVAATKYRGPVKVAIQKVKYRWVYDIGKTLVGLVVDNLWRFDLPSDLILVPVPLHPKRKRWRGFNQAEILARILAEAFKIPLSVSLIRISETEAQVGLDRKLRKENVRGAFALAQNAQVLGRNILLVDDVYTSGATMQEACRVLKKAGARQVWAMTVALG